MLGVRARTATPMAVAERSSRYRRDFKSTVGGKRLVSKSTSNDPNAFNRAAFLAGGLATISAALPERSRAATSLPPGVTPERLLGRLMAGNKRFIDNDFPTVNRLAEKRELL